MTIQGTLTTGRMAVSQCVSLGADGGVVFAHSAATSYDPTAAPLTDADGAPVDADALAAEPYRSLSLVCSLCNAAHIMHAPERGSWEHTGEPTEAALRTLAEKIGAAGVPESSEEAPERTSDYWRRQHQIVATLEFSRERKSMSVITVRAEAPPHGAPPSAYSLLVKGAPESVIERCDYVMLANGTSVPLTARTRAMLDDAVREMAGGSSALRCLACALRHGLSAPPSALPLSEPAQFATIESGLTLVGVVGLRDPPRPEVADAIATCVSAGIRVVCITGDNPITAAALCKSVGLLDETFDDESASADGLANTARLAYTGREFSALDDAAKRDAVKVAALFSRTEPAHKLQLVGLLQEAGHVVAMTGDGVNDAPALKRANIGVAMGSGTAVAKGAADMVLADDNFSTIVAAVEEGRCIFNNTQATPPLAPPPPPRTLPPNPTRATHTSPTHATHPSPTHARLHAHPTSARNTAKCSAHADPATATLSPCPLVPRLHPPRASSSRARTRTPARLPRTPAHARACPRTHAHARARTQLRHHARSPRRLRLRCVAGLHPLPHLLQHRRGRLHLPRGGARPARGPRPGAATLGQSGHRRPPCDRAHL